MKERARDVVRMGDKLFQDKKKLDSLWQEIALNFYPERANFTSNISIGDDVSGHNFSSYPVLARRELGNLIAANTRPRDRRWMSIHVDDDELDDGDEERAFMELLTDIQFRAMYDRDTNFVRSTKETDHDLVTFGQGVIDYGLNKDGDGLLYRNWHLRDCAWSENEECRIDALHRNWEPSARQLVSTFGKKVSEEVRKAYEKDPEKTFPCRHVVLPSRLYEHKTTPTQSNRKFPFTSLFIEVASETILEEVGTDYFPYVVPRWHTVSGSQYASSMATSVLLPDGRTLQVVMRTLREAGENYVNPPLIAVTEAVRGDIALYPGGVTTIDAAYDERLGEALRPLAKDRSGFPIGVDIAAALKEDIRNGFLLDKIQLPEVSKTMTAFEVRRRIEEHLRASAPIFEPITEDYSDPICSGTFKLLKANGAFPMDRMPASLSDRDVKFKFRSPMSDMAEQADAEAYMDVRDRILVPVMQIDPAQIENVDMTKATRDAMRSAGWKAKWFRPIEGVEAKREQMQAEAEAQKQAQKLATVGAIAEQGGKGLDAVVSAGRNAMAPPQSGQPQPAKPQRAPAPRKVK